MSLPRNMRVPRQMKNGHFYIDPTGIDVYVHITSSTTRVRISRRQIRQALAIMDKYAGSAEG